jgi:hypothetical protein
MIKKILFIQTHYFVGGHYFQSFNNLIKNLQSFEYYNFLVSLGSQVIFKNDFNKLNKEKKILTFSSVKNPMSFINDILGFIKTLKLRHQYDVFFYYDVDPFRIAILNLFFGLIYNQKKTVIYYAFNPMNYDKNIFTYIKLIIIKNFFLKKNNFLFLRTLECRNKWRQLLNIKKKKVNFLKPIDYHPTVPTYSNFKSGPLKFGVVGQIRYGKSLDLLNKFFKNNTEYKFNIIGGYANKNEKKKFDFIDRKFISKKNFLSYKDLISKGRKLDYLILLYDKNIQEVSSFYLAARLKIPVIFYKKSNWLRNIYLSYKFGLMIKSFDEFGDFYSRKDPIYLRFIKELYKYEKDNLDTMKNEKLFRIKIYKILNYK